MKRGTKETVNLLSLIFGIILIIVGLGGSAILIPARSPLILAPILSLIIGSILALMGGLRKWGWVIKKLFYLILDIKHTLHILV